MIIVADAALQLEQPPKLDVEAEKGSVDQPCYVLTEREALVFVEQVDTLGRLL